MLLWLWIIPLVAGHPLRAEGADTKAVRQAVIEALEPTFSRADLNSDSCLDNTEYASFFSLVFVNILHSYSSDETMRRELFEMFLRSLRNDSCWNCYQPVSSSSNLKPLAGANLKPLAGRHNELELSKTAYRASSRQVLSDTNSSAQPTPTASLPTPSAQRSSVVSITNASHAEDELEMAIATPDVDTVLLNTSIQLTQNLSTVSRSLAIIGSCSSAARGCEIDGNHSVRIFLVDGGEGSVELQLSGLVLQAGYSASHGGAIYSSNSATLSLYNVIVQDSFARSCGGGIYLESGQLFARQSSFIANSAGQDGGGIYATGTSFRVQTTTVSENRAGKCGGAIYVHFTTLLLEDHSAVLQNNATLGGGVFGTNQSTIVVRNHTCLCSNSAVSGGGIRALEDSTVEVYSASVVCNNTAVSSGGGIFALHSKVSVSSGSVISGNVGEHGGGICIIYNICAFGVIVFFMSDSVIHSNIAFSRGGGVLYATDYEQPTICGVNFKLQHSSLYGNHANNSGGGLFSHAGIEANNCTVSNNTALNFGGGVSCQYDLLEATNGTTFSGNCAAASGGGFYARSLLLSSATVTENTADGSGGGGFLDLEASISHCNFTNNQGGYRGGALALSIFSTVNLFDTLLAGNSAVYSHGGALSAYQNAYVVIQDCILRDNSSPRSGGCIHLEDGASLRLSRSTLEHNAAGEGGGGVATFPNSELKVEECTLTENRGQMGGAIYNSGPISLHSSQLHGNTAMEGGAMFMTAPAPADKFQYIGCFEDQPVRALHLAALPSDIMTPYLCADLCSGFEFFGTQNADECFCGTTDFDRYGESNNCIKKCKGDQSVECGGGWANSVYRNSLDRASIAATALISKSNLSSNSAPQGSGGAVHQIASTLVLTDGTTLSNNSCNLYGGGVYAEQMGTVQLLNDSRVTHNSAQQSGGGLYVVEGTLHINQACSIDGNSALQEGGGAMVVSGSVEGEGCHVFGNAASSGGGINVVSNGTLEVENMTFSANTARHFGGAVACSYSTCTLRGVVGIENMADDLGGFIYLFYSEGVVEESILRDLRAGYGGGMYGTDSTASLSDVRLLACHAESSGGGLFIQRSHVFMQHTVVEKCEGISGGGVSVSENSTLHIASSSFINNSAATGHGGALAFDNTHAAIDQVLFQDNLAEQGDAGAVWVDDQGVMSMSASVFSGNQALNGGGVACSVQCSLHISDVGFVENVATQWGAAIFLNWPNVNYTITMHSLKFTAGYAAATGSNIFWKAYPAAAISALYPGTAIPSCSGCHLGADDNASAVMASTAVDFKVTQGEAGEAVTAILCSSAVVIEPPIVYHALDHYGARTSVPERSYTVAVSSDEDFLLKDDFAYYAPSGAVFDGLVATGTPGQSFNITTVSSLQSLYAWKNVTVQVALIPCIKGEVYDPKLNVCTQCEPGMLAICFLSFHGIVERK
ncbi:hypothetical protein CYMTET_22474 [Cymbomonas tetramitiformis]|uniref:WSC domain-containing protein n=1 Tax=Cymbomonas tetramitiformis TaxID=36881 RepID=A0AAE0L1Y2_9CHLO|nr:hypothetical protein CYMTET_22474 [Cymbomonas tetramitiformis]